MFLNEFFLEVAAFTIKFFTKEDAMIYIPEGYVPFIVSSDKTPDVVVEIKQDLPFLPENGKEIFNAINIENEFDQTNNILWNIVADGNNKLVFTAEPYRNIYPYLAADFSDAKGHWTIFNSEIAFENGVKLLNPLAYPMGPLLLYHLALYNKSIMIHASGVEVGQEGLIFTGFSGVGKSTMAGLWQQNGFNIVNDDRLLIRKIEGQYYFFNTPMTYSDVPKRAPLKAAFLIRHYSENKIVSIDGMESISKLMAFCIQHHYNSDHIKLILETVIDLAFNIDIYELGFVPNESVISEIIKLRSKS